MLCKFMMKKLKNVIIVNLMGFCLGVLYKSKCILIMYM